MSGIKDILGDQFYESKYPQRPGFTELTTSRDAARRMTGSARILQARIMDALHAAEPQGLTADECAGCLGESVLAVRPRFTELKTQNKIMRSGERRKNESGMNAHVLRPMVLR